MRPAVRRQKLDVSHRCSLRLSLSTLIGTDKGSLMLIQSAVFEFECRSRSVYIRIRSRELFLCRHLTSLN